MKTKQKKINARVDFTPMVDMMMLLITFFMLCTTLSKPQTMEIAMPTNKTENQNRSQVATEEAYTVILDVENKVYYYRGKPTDAANTMKQVYYASGDPINGLQSLHAMLKKANPAYESAENLRKEYEVKINTAGALNEEIVKAEFEAKLSEIKSAKGTPQVLIKPLDGSTYENLIEVLDEMTLCNIGKYVIVPCDDTDKATLEAFKSK